MLQIWSYYHCSLKVLESKYLTRLQFLPFKLAAIIRIMHHEGVMVFPIKHATSHIFQGSDKNSLLILDIDDIQSRTFKHPIKLIIWCAWVLIL